MVFRQDLNVASGDLPRGSTGYRARASEAAGGGATHIAARRAGVIYSLICSLDLFVGTACRWSSAIRAGGQCNPCRWSRVHRRHIVPVVGADMRHRVPVVGRWDDAVDENVAARDGSLADDRDVAM